MNRRSWIAWAVVTGLLMVLVFLIPQSVVVALIAIGVVVAVSRVPSQG